MARARNIKPALFKNELLGVADPMLTILFTSLWCLADKRGRLEDRPLRIKAETFPYREGIDINVYLTELERLKFIHRYEISGLSIIQIINFDKHQNPHKTEKDSTLPEYSEESVSCGLTVKDTLTNGIHPADSLNTDSLNSLSNTRISELFEPENKKAQSAKYPTLDLETEKQKFIAHYMANGSERRDWQAQFRKWMLGAQQLKADVSQRSPPINGNKPAYKTNDLRTNHDHSNPVERA